MSSTQEVGDIFGSGRTGGLAHAMLRSPTVLILSVGLWGMNIFFYKLFGIDYRYVLMKDVRDLDGKDEYGEDQLSEEKKTDSANSSKNNNLNASKHDDGDDSGGDDTSLSKRKRSSDERSVSASPSTYSPALKQSANGGDGGDDPDRRAAIEWQKLVMLSVALLAMLRVLSWWWMVRLDRDVVGAVALFYLAVIVAAALPLARTRWLRAAAAVTLRRSFELVRPRCHVHGCGTRMQRPIPFVDVFFADAMCSLSKVFFDWGMLLHMASHYPHPVPPSWHNIVIPSCFAAAPYAIRARQCLIMFDIGRRKGDRSAAFQHVANAAKYSTSIFPLILSAYQKTLSDATRAKSLEGLLVFLLVVNATYALYWDIVMDWGMMQNPTALVAQAAGCAPSSNALAIPQAESNESDSTPNKLRRRPLPLYSFCRNGFLRSRLRFGFRMSLLIVLADCLLRFSWLLRFLPDLFPSHDAFILGTQFLEVFRRAIWNLLRVEWENIKQQRELRGSSRSSDDVGGDDDDDYSAGGWQEEEEVTFAPEGGAADEEIELMKPLFPTKKT